MSDQDWNIENELEKLRARRPERDTEAASRYEQWRRCDPYPNIDPTLLNSADFCDYVVETGMIYPFNVSKKDIKLATYAFRIKGKVVRWTRDNKKEEFTVGVGKDFDTEAFQVRQDSIAFVTLEPYLRIPDYIALRFNLKINNVYRGLLLGTGPIVDPGYQGKLSIPLHNLTTNNYIFGANERLVWVEFTKISRPPVVEKFDGEAKERSSLYIPFPSPKEDVKRDVLYHIREADPHRSIRSSIPDAIYSARKAADNARKEASNVSTLSTRSYYISLGVLTVGLVSILAVSISYAFAVKNLSNKVARQEAQIEYLQNINQIDNHQPTDTSRGGQERGPVDE